MHPGDDSPADVLRAALDEQGLRVAKLHCSVGGFSVDDSRLFPFWSLVEQRKVPVVVHAGHEVSGETAGHELGPVGLVAELFPGASIVVAHAGHPATDVALSLVEAHHERVLFGSDLPNTQVRLDENLRWLDELSPAARTAVTTGNATRLLAAAN